MPARWIFFALAFLLPVLFACQPTPTTIPPITLTSTPTATLTITTTPTVSPSITPTTTPVALGKTWFVDAINGNDANPGSQQAPFQRLQKAIASIQSGDTVIVNSGIYPIDVAGITFGPAGTPSQKTIFRAAPNARPLVTRADHFTPYVLFKDYVRVEGFWFGGIKNPNASPTCICLGGSPMGRGKEFVGNTVFNFVEGLSGGSVEYSLIQGNRFVNDGWASTKQHSIYLSGDDMGKSGGASNHVIVDNNIIVEGIDYGIQGWHQVHSMIFTRNFIAHTTWGIVADGSDHLIANNFIWEEQPLDLPYTWGHLAAGQRTAIYNNVYGPDGWLNDAADGRSAASANIVSNNAFSTHNIPDFWWFQPFGTNQRLLTWGNEQNEIGVSEADIDATLAALRTSFNQTDLNMIYNDATIETSFAKIRGMRVPQNSPLYQTGTNWFGANPINIGPDAPAPQTQDQFWAAFRALGLRDWDRCNNQPPNKIVCP